MVQIVAALLTLLLTAHSVVAQGPFGFDNPNFFPNQCKKSGQVSIIYAEGPSRYTADLLNTVARNGGNVTAKDLTFFPVTSFLRDVTSNVPLRIAANNGSLIGLRWNTQVNLANESDAAIIQRLQDDCNTLYTYTGKYVKYIFLPRDQITQAKYDLVKAQGYVPVGYNIDSLDYTQANYTTESACTSTVVNAYNAQIRQLGPGAAYYVALQRDLYQCTAVSAPAVFRNLQGYGYTVVDLATCLGDASPYRTSCTATAGAVSPSPAPAPATGGASPAPAPASATAAAPAPSTATAAAAPSAASPTRAAASGAESVSGKTWMTVGAVVVGLVAMIM